MPLRILTPGGSMLVSNSYAEGSMLVRTDIGHRTQRARPRSPRSAHGSAASESSRQSRVLGSTNRGSEAAALRRSRARSSSSALERTAFSPASRAVLVLANASVAVVTVSCSRLRSADSTLRRLSVIRSSKSPTTRLPFASNSRRTSAIIASRTERRSAVGVSSQSVNHRHMGGLVSRIKDTK